jgi:hypothetical protein
VFGIFLLVFVQKLFFLKIVQRDLWARCCIIATTKQKIRAAYSFLRHQFLHFKGIDEFEGFAAENHWDFRCLGNHFVEIPTI